MICLLAFTAWLVEVTLILGEKIREHLAVKRLEKEALRYLDTLTIDEARFFTIAMDRKSQTVLFRSDFSEVHSLIEKNLLLDGPHNADNYKPYTIPHFVWDELLKPSVVLRITSLAKKDA